MSTPSLSPRLVFTKIPSTSTCANITISWNYTGPDERLSLFVANGSTSAPDALSLVAYSLAATVQEYAWASVNITPGVYEILALGQNVSSLSPPFVVSADNTQTCATRSSDVIHSAGPHSSARGTHVGAIVGGVVGGLALLGAVVGVYIYFNLRAKAPPGYRWKAFTSVGRRGRPALWSGLSSHVNVCAPSSSPPISTTLIGANEKERVRLSALPRLEPNRRRPSTSLAVMVVDNPASSADQAPAPPPSAFLRNKELPRPPSPPGASASASARTSTTASPDRPCKSCVFDGADVASFVWLRRHSSAGASPTRRPSGASVVPSSATSQMYRVRDSMWTASPGSPEPLGRASPEARCWCCGHCGGVRRAKSVQREVVVPDVPRLPGGEP
ncbi:hypothetical protein BC628DRAFT_379825 [Trametes gibbosa]|nr:hypothetical protein BC628DRAFT_379825 [Trametes gibbosa]